MFQKKFFCLFFIFLFTGCLQSTYVKNLHLNMDVSEAPEVHGANTYQLSNTSLKRLTGKLNYNIEDEREFDNGSRDIVYEVGVLDFTFKYDYIKKGKDYLFAGAGVGYKDGLFYHFSLGANMPHIEIGGFLGLYHHFTQLDYKGKYCTEFFLFFPTECEPFSKEYYDITTSFFVGAFASFYLEKFFINYSVSVYDPTVTLKIPNGDYSLSLPSISSHYLALGYRLNKKIEFTSGAIFNYINSPAASWYIGFTSGINFYL